MSEIGDRLIEYQREGQCTLSEFGVIQHFVNWLHAEQVKAERREVNGWPWWARPGETSASVAPAATESKGANA